MRLLFTVSIEYIVSQKMIYFNCSCVLHNVKLSSSLSEAVSGDKQGFPDLEGSAEIGQCTKDCSIRLIVFTSGMGFMVFMVFIMKIPSVLLTLR